MVVSSTNIHTKNDQEVININKNSQSRLLGFKQNGQIQIYQSSYRCSYTSIIKEGLRNAALGRKVLLVQLMKGGVHQGVSKSQNLCGNLTWIRPSKSFDEYNLTDIVNNKQLVLSIQDSILELWCLCKKELVSGNYDQIIIDEIFLAIEKKIIDKDDLISTLENRFMPGDVILTGTAIPKNFLLMADQVTELRS